jgi:ATP synthase protein I
MDRTLSATRDSGVAVLLGGLAVTVGLGVLTAVVAGLASGAPAAGGVVVGVLVVALVCVGGSLLVNAVAGVLPAASLLVALLTYTLQVMVLLLVFVALERSDLLGEQLDREWLGGAAIGATLAWLVTQVVLTFRRRIPVFDLPADAASGPATAGRPHGAEGGER